jgi:hypothetical protein
MFCGRELKQTYGIKVGQFVPLDSGGPKTKDALTAGSISIGLVFSSDSAFAAGWTSRSVASGCGDLFGILADSSTQLSRGVTLGHFHQADS